MSEKTPTELWSEFLAAWPLERVREMTIEEYTNPNKDDAFIYWLESHLQTLGSIWGGSAFKFGVYCRDNTDVKETAAGRAWGDKYAWATKYGATAEEAFAVVKSRLTEVAEAAAAGNFARVEEIDLAPVLKWKVAFLYQDRKQPSIFPIFKKQALFANYTAIDPRAKLSVTPYYVMYETLLERHRSLGNVFKIERTLWEHYQSGKKRKSRAWAVPLSWAAQDPDGIEELCAKTRVEPEDVDSLFDSVLTGAEVSEGDKLALLVNGDVRALGTLTTAEAGQFSWDQAPVNFPSGLVAVPTSEPRELSAAERDDIWSHTPSSAAPRYWKIAPGANANRWPEWRERGIASIGWPELGDLARVDRAEFDRRAAKCAKEHNYSRGMLQVWTFLGIRPDDRIVANHGKHTVLATGTVVGSYRYAPGTLPIKDEDHPHQISVRWDDVAPKPVEKYGWQRTLVELSKEDFDALSEAPVAEPNKPARPHSPPAPCLPRNVIVYGPPGTGKTYSTVRRALELILGPEALQDMRDEKLLPLFRDHQARGRIEFVTFHQAYGYEEFVEGIRPVLDQAVDAQVRYEIHDGVFKRIALRAAAEGLRTEGTAPEFDELWNLLLRDLRQDETRTAKSQSGKTYQLSLSNQGNVLVNACEVDGEGNVISVSDKHQTASKENARLYWRHRAELGPDPDKLTYEKTTALFAREKGGGGGNHYTALWLVYAQLVALNQVAVGRKTELIDRTARVQQALDKPGPSTTFGFSVLSQQYVLIVDEINRGNMSKILGELITLLEPDKRLSARNELKLPLSYSPQHRFAVPPNLHVIGTMNTADRSIALMDVALRRRFTFEELMPNGGVIRSVLGGRALNPAFVELVVDVFETLNERIRFLYDRDHQLGHSYFLDVTDIESLRQVFVDRILPMLQEYFYGAWDKICIVLGCPYHDSGEPKRREPHLLASDGGGKSYAHAVVTARSFTEERALGFDHDDYEDRVDYLIHEAFRTGSLSSGDLCRTFLGLLPLDSGSYDQRLADVLDHSKAE